MENMNQLFSVLKLAIVPHPNPLPKGEGKFKAGGEGD